MKHKRYGTKQPKGDSPTITIFSRFQFTVHTLNTFRGIIVGGKGLRKEYLE